MLLRPQNQFDSVSDHTKILYDQDIPRNNKISMLFCTLLLFGKANIATLDIPDGFIIKQIPTLGSKDAKTHWFDKLAKIFLFSIKSGKISSSWNFFLPSEAYKHYCKTGEINLSGFAGSTNGQDLDNQNVNVFALTSTINNPNEVIAVTETPPQIYLDGSRVHWKDKLPKTKIWESAHPLNRYGPTYNYLIKFSAPSSHYVFYKIVGKSRRKIAEICTTKPSYMHSFGETKNYLLLMETPLRMTKSYPQQKGYIRNFTWQPDHQSKLFIVHKETGKIKTLNTPPYYFYHAVNAYEASDQKIIFDTLGQKEGAPLVTDQAKNNKYLRYTIDLRSDVLECAELNCKDSVDLEFPVINENYAHKHRYVYMVALSNSTIVKYDTQTQKIVAQTKIKNLGEPIFVPKKSNTKEDDGYLFSICTDPAQLVVFDAHTLKVITKIDLPERPDNIGLHGKFFKQTAS